MEEEISIPESKYFILKGGKKLGSIEELVNELRTMSDDVFYFHVNDYKNDFENWIRFVFMNEELANKVSKLRTKNDFLLELQNYLLKKSFDKEKKEFFKKKEDLKQEKNPRIIELETRLENIKKRISELRKQGFQTKNAELLQLLIPSKIKFAEITNNDLDFFKAEQSIKNLELELKEIENSKPDDIQEEISEIKELNKKLDLNSQDENKKEV
ncbi:MAG: DUF5752 family protein [Candidatus Woesearchaeota archaeon]